MAHQIEQEETAREPAHVPDQPDHVLLGKVMAEIHRERQIRLRQRIADGVRPNDGKPRVPGPARNHIDSHGLHSELLADLSQHSAGGAADIQHPSHRQGIASNGFHDAGRVTQVPVDPGELSVRLMSERVGYAGPIQNLLLFGPFHVHSQALYAILAGPHHSVADNGGVAPQREVLVIGGGPAGAAAAIAAACEGASVRVLERSRGPRHKVCGEFLSPGALPILESLGVPVLGALRPAPIRTCRLRFGHREKQWTLGEPALGLSRFALDNLLLCRAEAVGAAISRGEAASPGQCTDGATTTVLAVGRRPSAPSGERLFGFKAHFEGPQDDAVDLYFAEQAYAGVSPVENGWTNVCGIAPEAALRIHRFDVDEYVERCTPLAERIRGLRRRMKWLLVGPLSFSTVGGSTAHDHVYAAGDALGFVDPFTGSGILNALATGRLAGRNAARAVPATGHLAECRALLRRPFEVSAVFRKLIEWNCAWRLAAWTPGRWLFGLTRARLSE